MLASTLLSLTQGLGANLISGNLTQIQGSLGATTNEATWLVAAYMAPNVSLSLMLIKVRTQYGLRRFAEIGIAAFVLISLLHLFVADLHAAIAIRFLGGIAAAPLSSLAFLYMLEPFAPAKKLTLGLSLALTNTSLAMPVARLISPQLLQLGQLHGLLPDGDRARAHVVRRGLSSPAHAQPRAKVIEALDVVSFLLIATGFGMIAAVLALGRVYWWTETPFLGVLLALGIASVTVAAVIELNRENPLVDVRWLASRQIVHLTAALLIFRIVLSEHATGATGFSRCSGSERADDGALLGHPSERPCRRHCLRHDDEAWTRAVVPRRRACAARLRRALRQPRHEPDAARARCSSARP